MAEERIINDDNWEAVVEAGRQNGDNNGCIERDFNEYPIACMSGLTEFPDELLIDPSEQPHWLEKQIEAKAQLSDIRNRGNYGQPIPSLDQNPWGYCWNHSTVHAAMLVRASNNQPYVPLSAFAGAAIVKNYRDLGGHCVQALQFIREVGAPSQALWPQKKVDRRLDTPEMRANAALHKVEEWWDFSQNKAKRTQQMISALLRGIPVAMDVYWWRHSICVLDVLGFNPLRVRIWNSYGDQYGNNGTEILEGNRAMPDNAVAPRVIVASAI